VAGAVGVWNGQRGAWETGQLMITCEHSALYEGPWPERGSLRGGTATAGQPLSYPVPAGVRLLPTPCASDYKGPCAIEGRERGGRLRKPGDADLPYVVRELARNLGPAAEPSV
jgi:hypothetical protein